MRSHCSVLALFIAAWSSAALAQPVPAGAVSNLKIYVRGAQVGTEDVTVVRSADGLVISGSGRLSPPIDVVTNRCEMRYDAQGKPVDLTFDALVHGQYTSLHTVFTDGTAATQALQAGVQAPTKTDKIAPDAVVLLNAYFGLYEGLAARLREVKAGSDVRAYIAPQIEIALPVKVGTEWRWVGATLMFQKLPPDVEAKLNEQERQLLEAGNRQRGQGAPQGPSGQPTPAPGTTTQPK